MRLHTVCWLCSRKLLEALMSISPRMELEVWGQVPRAGRLRAQPLMTGPAAVTPQPLRLACPAIIHFNDEFWKAGFNYPEKKNT